MDTIQVTQEHIEQGTPGQSNACAIRLALAERYPQQPTIEVGDYYIMIGGKVYMNGFGVGGWIKQYDALRGLDLGMQEIVKPITLEVHHDRLIILVA